MTGRGNGNGERDRAVTVQIGAVILFGFLIVALSTYQATVVPDQNREVEFLHNQEVQTDMVELSSSMAATGRTGDGAPATVKLGTRYPSRTFFVNPPPASGSLRTVPPDDNVNVSLENLTVLSSADRDEAADYWDLAESRNKSTRFVVYEPRYSNYREAPTTRYESGIAFNRFPNGANLTLTDQRVVEGDRITLIAVSGDLNRNGVSTVSVDPEAVSTVSRRERVSGELDVTIPTTLNATRWEELLADEIDDGWVNGTRNAPGGVTIELNDSRTYSLGIAAVHVGSGDGPDRSPAYLDVEQRPSEMSEGTTREVVVEVRDQFGNPVDGVDVAGETNGSGSLAADTVATDDDGRAVFEYTPDEEGTEELRFSYDGLGDFDALTAADADVTVEVNAGGGGDGSTGDPNPPDSVVLVDSYRKQNDNSIAVLELENRGEQTVNSSQVRLNFYSQSGGSNPTQAELTTAAESPTLDIGGPFENATIEFQPNVTRYVCYDYDAALNQDEFFVTTYEFDNGIDEQYFVGLNNQQDVTCGDETGGGSGGDGGGGGGSPPAEQNGIRYDGNLGTTGSNSAIQFDITNVDSNEARVNAVEIRSTIDEADRVWNGGQGDYEVTVNGGAEDGYEEGRPVNDPSSGALNTDGTRYSFDSQARLTTSGGGSSATVFVGEFVSFSGNSDQFSEYDFGNLNRVSNTAQWDVSITLGFQNRGDVTFYFEET